MERLDLQASVAWLVVIPFSLLHIESNLPIDTRRWAEKDLRRNRQILRGSFQLDSFVIRSRFLCVDRHDKMVVTIYSKLHFFFNVRHDLT